MKAPIRISIEGDNRPKLVTTDQLSKDFDYLITATNAAIKKANELPHVFEDEEDMSLAREAVKFLQNEAKRIEAKREETKAPYLDAERVVQSWFKQLVKRIEDVQEVIDARGKKWLDRKAEQERKRREEEARLAREVERKRQEEAEVARRAAEEEQRKAQEALLVAQREADDAKRKIAAEVADAIIAQAARKESEARAARRKEIDAAAIANQAQRAAEVKPADLARTRSSSGGLATLAESFDFEILDLSAVDLEALRSYISRPDIEKAIRAYVRIHKDTSPLRGVRIFPTTNPQWR